MSEINVDEINKRVQNLFRTLQNDPKSIFCTINRLSKTILNKVKKKKKRKKIMIRIKYLQIYTNSWKTRIFFKKMKI